MENTDFGGIKFDLPKNQSNVIKVIGVGGGGSNAINHMFKQGIKGVDFVVCNTDSQALENSAVPNKIQLGMNLTEGLGAGANPEVGQKSAIESIEDIEKILDNNTKMVFITAGMGGGTGTGAAPVIAQIAKEKDILTVGIVTIPFQFEGKHRQAQALKGVEKLRNQVDSLIVINNNKLREVYGNLGFKAGFAKADEVLSTAARGIAEVITHHYTQNIDLKDAKTVLSDSGTAIMGSSTASGENRAKEAIIDALDSPLLNDNKIAGAKNVLLLIVSGNSEITIDEIGEINDHIQTEAGHNANIIMGVGEDESLGEAVSVTIIATGFNIEQQKTIVTTEEPQLIIHTLSDDQKVERDLSGDLRSNKINYATPDQPLAGMVDNAESNGKAEDKKVYSLEDVLEDRLDLESLTGLASVKESPSSIGEKAQDLDVFFEIVTPVQKEEPVVPEVVADTLESKEEIEEKVVKTRDFREIKIVDPEFVIATPKNQQVVRHVIEQDAFDEDTFEAENTEEVKLVSFAEKKEEKIYFDLGDYTKEEEKSPASQPLSQNTDDIQDDFFISQKKMNVESSTTTLISNDEVNPMEMSIEEFSLRNRASERRKTMKDYNHKFVSSAVSKEQVDSLESEPAYKRTGMMLEETDDSLQKSRVTVSSDMNNEIKLRSNNSFLHDNVD